MFRSKGSIAAWIVGGITLMSLAVYLFSSWFSSPGVPRIEFKSPSKQKVDPVEEVEDLEEEDEEEEEEDEGADVEDVEEEDEEDAAEQAAPTSAVRSEEANKEDQMKVFKAQYDAASKECSALIASQKFAEAVDKLSELIGLAGKVQRGQAEIVTLYNNRSAMFEKIQEYEKALSDIRVMLLMQSDHVRARARRARIYEAQGSLEEAVEEYVICNWIEQARREMPTNEARATELFKKIAIAQAASKFTAIQNEVFSESSQAESTSLPPHSSSTALKDRPLPSKAYAKNVLETFPNTFTWRRLVDQTTRANLVAKLQDAKDKFNLMAPDAEQMQRSDAALEVLKATLDVVQLDLSQDNVAAGFGVLRAAEDAARSLYVEEKEPEDQVVRQHLSQFFELLGTEAQFKSLPAFALRCYRHSYALSELNFSVQLKLAALYLELDVESAAVAIYERLLSGSGPVGKEAAVDDGSAAEADDVSVNSRRSTGSFSSQVSPLGLSLDSPKLRQAWTQLHRAALYVQRQADGKYLPDAVTKAVDALEQLVLAPLDGEGSAESVGAMFIAYVKIVNMLTHTKASMEQASTDEDNAKCQACIQAAKLLDPEHDSVMLLEAEQLSHESKIDEALAVLDKVKRRMRLKKRIADPESTDVVFMVAKASVLSAQAFSMLGAGNMNEAHEIFSEVDGLYRLALDIDPTAIEVMAQQAQLRSMIFADFDSAVRLIEKAVPLFRSRDELQDILQMLVTFRANQRGLQFVREAATA